MGDAGDTPTTWVTTDWARLRGAWAEALSWCQRVDACTEAPNPTRPFGQLLQTLVDGERPSRVFVGRVAGADAEFLGAFQKRGSLLVLPDAPHVRGEMAWFSANDEVRGFVSLAGESSGEQDGSTSPWMFVQARRNALPPGLVELWSAVEQAGVALSDSELANAAEADNQKPVHRRQIRAVRDIHYRASLSGDSWLAWDVDVQVDALWSALLGEGPVEVERAVRLGARRLRAQGWLQYQALRQRGEIYRAIEERLLSARRSDARFDRPHRGHVRAIEPDVDQLSADDWRDCLMGGLAEHYRVERTQAVRLAFDYAREVYGVAAQRLRSGGRAERAIKSAINSAIRQGYLQRDGAAYVIRVADIGKPQLRGVVERPASEAPVADDDTTLDDEPTDDTPMEASNQATVAPAHVEPLGSDEEPEASPADNVLERSLRDLEFPTRTLKWADANGVVTLADLVAWNPDDFLQAPSVGGLTLRRTRSALEEAIGCTWEEAWAASQAQRPIDVSAQARDEEATTAQGARGWAGFAETLDEHARQLPLAEVELPTRMRNFIEEEELDTVGDLLRHSYEELRARPNMGRKTLNDTLDAITDHLASPEDAAQHLTFLALWQAQVAGLKPMHRLILSRRAGLHGQRETLEDLGSMLGVTRERVRQVEARVLERLRSKSRWKHEVLRQLEDAFGGARAVPIALLAEEPWWSGVSTQLPLLEFVLERVLDSEFQLFEAPSGAQFVARFGGEDYRAAVEAARQKVAALSFPAPYANVLAVVREQCARLDEALFDEIEMEVRATLRFDEVDDGVVSSAGGSFAERVVSFLNAQPEPVGVATLLERVGRGVLPEEVLYFKRGVVGLKRHFPDFDPWSARLVPQCIAIMEERAPGRQWLVTEIHDELKSRGELPEWLGHWHLASLLRTSGEVDYLGRLRVALRGTGSEQRLEFEDVFYGLLEEAGEPLPLPVLMERARQLTDVKDATASLLLNQSPFVPLDDELIGLVERDVPGGPEAVAAAVESVATHLEKSQIGLTPYQATQLVQQLSLLHATYTRPLVVSLLRNEPTIRIDRTRNIGLAEWDDARCPTRPELMRREVAKHGGRLAVDVLAQQMAALYGNVPERAQLAVLAEQAELRLVGDFVERVDIEPTTGSVPPVSRLPLSGIPAEIREMFDELLEEPPVEPSELERQVQQHLDQFESEERVNEFVDSQGARQLAAQSRDLLGRWATLTVSDRRLAQAAIRYFVITEDVESDFDIGGLDDDKQVMAAVLEHLGVSLAAE